MMTHLLSNLEAVNDDLLTDIMARADGSALASAACTSSRLRDIAKDQKLWRQLCHSTWPSTSLDEARHLISSSPIGGFDIFYANSYPLISYEESTFNDSPPKTLEHSENLKSHIYPSDFVSLVDIYYKNKCILSKVKDGIPEAVDVYEDEAADNGSDSRRWFSNCPFKLDLLLLLNQDDQDPGIYDHSGENSESSDISSTSKVQDVKLREDHCQELVENLRLTWLVLDKNTGISVNLSSWKPLLVQKSWPFEEDYAIHFGSVIPVEESLIPYQLAHCKITVRCSVRKGEEGSLKWTEISMCIEDITGATINTRKSLMVLTRALYCRRSNNHLQVQKGLCLYSKKKGEMMKMKRFKEIRADFLCLLIELAIFVLFCFFLISPSIL